jgi:hypothetical protein
MHSGSALKAAALLLESDCTSDIVEGSYWHELVILFTLLI